MADVKYRSRAESAHRASVDYKIANVAGQLREHLGARLTAHIAGVSDDKAVRDWERSARAPQPETERRLRAALQVFLLVQSEESAHTARAWFIGMNPQLDDRAPADVLRDGDAGEVLAAAKAYITGG